MKTIEQIIEEMSKKYLISREKYNEHDCEPHYKAGAHAILKHLTEIGMAEFDEESFDAVYQPECENDEIHEAIERGARWQHEQTAAAVATLKLRIAELEAENAKTE